MIASMIFVNSLVPRLPAYNPHLERGTIGFLEIFAGSANVTRYFTERDIKCVEPRDILYKNFDIYDDDSFYELTQWIRAFRPELLGLAFECTDWSQIHNIMKNNPGYAKKLKARRKKSTFMLDRTRFLGDLQRSLGGHYFAENPKKSLAWKQPAFIDLMESDEKGIYVVDCDQCRYGLRCSSSGMLIKKPTTFGVCS